MSLKRFDQQTILLLPGDINMESRLELSQYTIEMWRLVYFDEENPDKGLKMEFKFKRILTNELLTTFLPSFFLLGICYATTFFKPFYFEASVTVNLTVMLVATTLFIRFTIHFWTYLAMFSSVMDKLPSVSYIRMVDIWLITVQLIPFLYVITRTASEMFDPDTVINHHGRTIDVSKNPKNNQLVTGMTSKEHLLRRARKALNLFGIFHKILSSLTR